MSVTTTTTDLARNTRRFRQLIGAVAIAVPLAVSTWLLAGLRVSAEVREFRGSYPEDAQPRGVVREVTLTATPAWADGCSTATFSSTPSRG